MEVKAHCSLCCGEGGGWAMCRKLEALRHTHTHTHTLWRGGGGGLHVEGLKL